MFEENLKWENKDNMVKIAYDGDYMYLAHDQITMIRYYGYKKKQINNFGKVEYDTVPFFGAIEKKKLS